MNEKWKLVYRQNRLAIHNEKGKDLSYDPNSGIRILVEDGYAFKDLNRNGILDPFEDWRLPMKQRIADFSQRYQLVSGGSCIYYKRGVVELPQDLLKRIQKSAHVQELLQEDPEYISAHAMIMVLLLLFDEDDAQYFSDYIIQLFLDSLDTGVLEQVFYTIKNAIMNYLNRQEAVSAVV